MSVSKVYLELKKHKLISFYVILFYAMLIASISYSQHHSDISELKFKKNPLSFILAANANWQTEIEIYFNSKVLTTKIDDYKLGFVAAGKGCGTEYCFRYSLMQQEVSDGSWYPSAIGVDADIFRLFLVSMEKLGAPKVLSFSLIYLFYSTLNLFFIVLIYLFIVSKTSRNFIRYLQILLLFTPWIFFSSMSIVFSPAIRFAPIFLYLFWRLKNTSFLFKSQFRTTILFALTFTISALHGFEFLPFLIGLLILLPAHQEGNSIRWLVFWLKPLLLGSVLSFLIWFNVLLINTGQFLLSVNIMAHTFFKQVTLLNIEAPVYSVDSGYHDVPLFASLMRYYFQTSGVFPHPFPNQISDLLGGSTLVVTLLFFSTSLIISTPFILIAWRRLTLFERQQIILSFCLNTIAVASVHGFTFHHRHFMGTVVTIHLVLLIRLISKGFEKKGGPNVV
jgi:hypothetical protein